MTPEVLKILRDVEKALEEKDRTDRLVTALEGIERQLGLIVLALTKPGVTRPPNPGKIRGKITGETEDMVTFKIKLPALPEDARDIASGELTVTIAGGEPTVTPVAKDATEVDGLSGEKDSTVELSFTYVDAAGNRSVHAATASITLTDTIPPPDPGALGVVITGEV